MPSTKEQPQLEPVSLQLEVISELHKAIGMRIDFHTSFTFEDEGEALREALGISLSTFSRLRRGAKEKTFTELKNLAEFFNTEVIKIIKANF